MRPGRWLTHLEAVSAHLLAKGGTARSTPRYRPIGRVGIIELAKCQRITDLSLSKALDAVYQLRTEGLSQETINHHVRAVKAFSRLLWRDGRAREHYLAHLATSNPEADRRLVRRALTPEESVRVGQDDRGRPDRHGMTGPDRAMLYALAIGTGLRSDGAANPDPRKVRPRFRFAHRDGSAAYSKNGKEAVQPLAATLAERLRPWIASKARWKARLRGDDQTGRPKCWRSI